MKISWKDYFENPRRIISVRPLENYTLLIIFDNGETKKYEMANELTGVFKVLTDKEKFNRRNNIDDSIDSSIYWENQLDLCKDMLYLESISV